MKTHDMARQLEMLARALRAGPNIELGQLRDVFQGQVDQQMHQHVKANLRQLLVFSKFSKDEWRELIKQYNLPIEVKATYSARDVVGKVLNYLDQHPEALDNLGKETKGSQGASPELLKALGSLMGVSSGK